MINISQSSPIEDADEILKPSYEASLKLSSTKDEFLDEDEKPCLLMVIMKQWQRLDKMISIFTHANDNGIDLSKVPTLIIDDEADHYSLDTKSNSKSNSKDKNSSEYYIVEEGDTLETISEKKFVPEEMLRNLNGFKEDEEINLQLGFGIAIFDSLE